MSFDDPFPPSSDPLRAGDAERDQAADALRRHHAEGRLSDEEFEQRLSRCYDARTFGELDRLFADLPRARQLGRRPGAAALGADPREVWRGAHPVAVVAAVLLALWVLGGAFAATFAPWGGEPHPHPFLVPLVLAFVVWRLVARRHGQPSTRW